VIRGYLLAVSLVAPFAACSSTASPPADGGAPDSGGASDRGGSDGGGTTCLNQPDLTAPTPMCNRAVNNARAVPFMARTGSPPVPSGGPIADGVYVSTAAEGYGATTPAGRRITLVVLAGATKMLWTAEVLDATGATVSLSFTANTDMQVSGNQLSFTVGCASVQPPQSWSSP
jgi:hypothetical protein